MNPAATSRSPLRATNRTGESSSELQEQIRRRAYDLYEQHGRTDGHDLDDWLQAETEFVPIKARKTVA